MYVLIKITIYQTDKGYFLDNSVSVNLKFAHWRKPHVDRVHKRIFIYIALIIIYVNKNTKVAPTWRA